MSQPEARLSRKIIERVRERGGFAFKIHGGPMMQAGLPDIIVCYMGRFIGLETKMPGGKATLIQLRTHEHIRQARGRAVVVRSVKDVDDLIDALEELWQLQDALAAQFAHQITLELAAKASVIASRLSESPTEGDTPTAT